VSLISLSCWNIFHVPSALGQYSRNFGNKTHYWPRCQSLVVYYFLATSCSEKKIINILRLATAADTHQATVQRPTTSRLTICNTTTTSLITNSASYPQRDGKWVVAYGLWGEGLVWLIGAVVSLLAANRGSNCSLTRAMDGCIVHCGIISSCQSAATSETVKRFWSRARVRSAIRSIVTFTFYLSLMPGFWNQVS